jgi:RNA polymerase sigma-70 factor (ECF subfamily)
MNSKELDHQTEQFTTWVREHSRAVRGYLLGLTRRADAADDLLQEVFRRAWQGRTNYNENGHARAYLLKIADRLLCDQHRKVRPEINLDGEEWKKHEPPTDASDSHIALAQQEEAVLLNKAMESLSSDQRRVLLLRYYGQLSFAEIAEEIRCPLSTALSHCRRGLETLRTVMGEKSQ